MLVMCAIPVNAQEPLSPATQQDLRKIQAAARLSDYSYEQARFLCNSIGPRLSGSPQAAAAVDFVREQMRQLGLDVQLEPVSVRHWMRGIEEAELVRYSGQVGGTRQKIIITALGNTIATSPGGLTAPLVVVRTFDELERRPVSDVKGKVVLFDNTFDEFAADAGRWEQAYDSAVRYRIDGPASAGRKGAIAVLVRSAGSGFRLPHTGVTEYKDGTPPIPAAAITNEDADLVADLASRGEVVVRLVLTPQDLAVEQSYNVIADLRGSRFPDEVVIVSAHLDSWDLGTGALDDAAGVGVAMDVLRIIKEVNPRPKRTIRFISWMNEENGGAGGRAYADDHRNELPRHIAAVELDYGDGRSLALEVHGTKDRLSPISPILRAIADSDGGLINVDESPGADLRAISAAGVPAIAPLQEARHYFDYHHTAADTFDKIRLEELRRTVVAIASVVYALAQE